MSRRSSGFVLPLLLIAAAAAPISAQETAPPVPSQEFAAPTMAPQAVLSPEAAQLLDEAVSGTLHDGVSLQFRPYFFPSLQGGTLTMIGFQPGKSGMVFGANEMAGIGADGMPYETASLELFGSVLQNGSEVKRIGASFDLRRDLGTAELGNLHSFGDTLPAGNYEIVWGVRDTVSGVVGTRRDSLEVPGFGVEFTTSSVLVATSFGAGQGPFGPNRVYPGIRVLTAAFEDDLDRVIDLEETPEVSLTYIVIGARVDPTLQAFNLEVIYRILDAESGESISRTPPQALNRTTVAQTIPLSTVGGLKSGGSYRFEITVRDLAADTELVLEVPFEIAG